MGYLEWWDHNRDSRKKSNKSLTATTIESKFANSTFESNFTLVTTTNIIGKALNIFEHSLNNTWIIDYGTTGHMTFDSRQVSSLKLSSQKFVCIANGKITLVIGEGSLTLTKSLNLDSVLMVLDLNYNLLYVSKITTALFCVIIFCPEFCAFKDTQTRYTIGCGIKRGKMYYLDLEKKSINKIQQALTINNFEEEKKKSKIWL